jgi:protein-disulfide isomerase
MRFKDLKLKHLLPIGLAFSLGSGFFEAPSEVQNEPIDMVFYQEHQGSAVAVEVTDENGVVVEETSTLMELLDEVEHSPRSLGREDAPISIEIYLDYANPSCKQWYDENLPRIVLDYILPGHARLSVTELPELKIVSISSTGLAFAAGEEGKYWEFVDLLFKNQSEWRDLDDLVEFGKIFKGYFDVLDINEGIFRTSETDEYMAAAIKEVADDFGILLNININSGNVFEGNGIATGFDGTNYETFRSYMQEHMDNLGIKEPELMDLISMVPNSARSLGSEDAHVTINAYLDYACPFSKRWYNEVLPKIIEDYIVPGHARLVVKDNPLTDIHKNALSAAGIAQHAGQEEKYWRMVNLLYLHQREWVEADEAMGNFSEYIKRLGLNDIEVNAAYVATYMVSLNEEKREKRTPYFEITNDNEEDTFITPISGSRPYDVFKECIEINLKSRED